MTAPDSALLRLLKDQFVAPAGRRGLHPVQDVPGQVGLRARLLRPPSHTRECLLRSARVHPCVLAGRPCGAGEEAATATGPLGSRARLVYSTRGPGMQCMLDCRCCLEAWAGSPTFLRRMCMRTSHACMRSCAPPLVGGTHRSMSSFFYLVFPDLLASLGPATMLCLIW